MAPSNTTSTINKLTSQLALREVPGVHAHTPQNTAKSDQIVVVVACIIFITAFIAMAFLISKITPEGHFYQKFVLLKARLNRRKFKTPPVTATTQPQGLRYTFEGDDLPQLNYSTFEQQRDFSIVPIIQEIPQAYPQNVPGDSPLPSYQNLSPTRPPAYEIIVHHDHVQ